MISAKNNYLFCKEWLCFLERMTIVFPEAMGELWKKGRRAELCSARRP